MAQKLSIIEQLPYEVLEQILSEAIADDDGDFDHEAWMRARSVSRRVGSVADQAWALKRLRRIKISYSTWALGFDNNELPAPLPRGGIAALTTRGLNLKITSFMETRSENVKRSFPQLRVCTLTATFTSKNLISWIIVLLSLWHQSLSPRINIP